MGTHTSKTQLRITTLKVLRNTIVILSVILIAIGGQKNAIAQSGDIEDILSSGSEDANLLLTEYLRPFGSGLGANLNSGWFNTAKPYRPFGFDLRVNAAVSLVPSADQFFNTSTLAFREIAYLSGPTESPTAFGHDSPGSLLGKTFINPENGQQEELFSFEMPQGIGYPYVPAPMAQITIGFIKQTDISLRFVPAITIEDDYEIGLWGIGIKHGLNQWISGGKSFPLDLSIQAGYTSLSANAGFELNPNVDQDTRNNFNASHWYGQGVEFRSTGFTGNLLFGKKLSILSLYGGVGYQNSKTTFKTPGNYPIVSAISPEDYIIGGPTKEIQSISDPIDLELTGANKYHALAGLRIRLLILTISASYTYSNYSTLNAGVGLSIR